ncbi:hypothetical protein [Lysobacter gummosus]|uniref:hypothetical protein n=1 Tax=Lysobacter gummosus TaxID=262324 RepID=UPI003625B22B
MPRPSSIRSKPILANKRAAGSHHSVSPRFPRSHAVPPRGPRRRCRARSQQPSAP